MRSSAALKQIKHKYLLDHQKQELLLRSSQLRDKVLKLENPSLLLILKVKNLLLQLQENLQELMLKREILKQLEQEAQRQLVLPQLLVGQEQQQQLL